MDAKTSGHKEYRQKNENVLLLDVVIILQIGWGFYEF